MKSPMLSLDQMKEWKRQIDSGVSSALFVDPKNGAVYTAKSVTEYVSGFFTGLDSTNGNILKLSNKPEPGIRSIDGKKLSPDVNQLVYAVNVLTDTTLIASTDAALKAADFANVAPAYFKNGEVRIVQGTELVRTTGCDVSNAFASTGNDDNYAQVLPFAFRDNMAFDVIFNLADTPTANHAYKFKYRAIEFVLASKAS